MGVAFAQHHVTIYVLVVIFVATFIRSAIGFGEALIGRKSGSLPSAVRRAFRSGFVPLV
jgi:hypothetical protein